MGFRLESLYFRDISRYRVFTDEEEHKLVKEVQEKKIGAVNKLITGNLRFVISVARKYRGRGLTYLELINEGNMGLLKAAERFNRKMNVKFISYAVWWVRRSIQKALLDKAGTVRIPPNKIALYNKFRTALDKNSGDYHKTIAMKQFKGREQDILLVMDKIRGISMETPIGKDRGSGENVKTMKDVLGQEPNQEEVAFRRGLASAIDGVLENITNREERILRMYYGLNFSRQFTLEEIGKELNLTRERVRLIRDRCLRKLYKNPVAREKLSPFFNSSHL